MTHRRVTLNAPHVWRVEGSLCHSHTRGHAMHEPKHESTHGAEQSAALYAFVAWLSGRGEVVMIGRDFDCAPLPPLIDTFCRSQGWAPPADDFPNTIQPYPPHT